MDMLRKLMTANMAIAVLLVCGGALAAGQLVGNAERVTVMIVSSMIALFFAVGGHAETESVAEPPMPAGSPAKLTDDPQFQSLLDALTDAVLIVENARVTHANAAALQLLGGGIIGQNVRIAFRHAGAIERLSDPDAQHDGRPIQLVGIGLRDQKWEMRIRSLSAGQKLVYLADRTSAQAAEKMRVDFVANASHELMTPLAAIKGFIETLSETEAGAEKKTRTRFLKIMDDEASRMQALIRDLMSLSRIEAEKYQITNAPVDMAAVIQDVVASQVNGGAVRGDDIAVMLETGLPHVSGDPGMLRQLVNNIIENAMKYGRAGTPINVGLSRSRSAAMIAFTVTDQGEGIAPEHLPRLTERFYRIDSGRSRSVGGTGLGLSLVKHIVDGHRGHLEIKSEQAVGTQIVILLPIANLAIANLAIANLPVTNLEAH
jgi:two-component system, OmpR family, phosphate regulon sensor histidine kinase PhoR